MKNILEVIKKAPKEHVYYSPLIGECHVDIIKCKDYPIIATNMNNEMSVSLSENGKFIIDSEIPEGECVLFPSRDNRDWEAFERELDGTKEAVQYVPVSENGVLSGYYQVAGMTEINLDHEYYKEHPYINFQIDGKEYKVSIEDIKRLVPSDVKDVKERFRIVEKGNDKYSIGIEDDVPVEMVSIPDRPMMAAVIMSGMLAGGCKDKGAALVNKALHLADLILDETETMEREKEPDGVGMHHMLGQSFNCTPKIVWDKKAKKISKRAKKWQGKIERYKKEVEPMMKYMA